MINGCPIRNGGGQKALEVHIQRAERRKPCQPRSLHPK